MIRNAICLVVAMLIIASSSTCHAAGYLVTEADLIAFISDNEDVLMTAEDLAFFLATHDFDARPEDGYVVVKLDGVTYKLVPNGDDSGLAEITVIG